MTTTRYCLGELWTREDGHNYRLYYCPHGLAASPAQLYEAIANGPAFDALSRLHNELWRVPLVREGSQAAMEGLR